MSNTETYSTLAFKQKKTAAKNEGEIKTRFGDRFIKSEIKSGKDERGNNGFQVFYEINK